MVRPMNLTRYGSSKTYQWWERLCGDGRLSSNVAYTSCIEKGYKCGTFADSSS